MKQHRKEGGAVAVELAFVLPLLLVVLIGIMEYGRVFNVQISLTQAAREGARHGAIYYDDSSLDVTNAALAAAPALAGLGVTVADNASSCSPGSNVAVTTSVLHSIFHDRFSRFDPVSTKSHRRRRHAMRRIAANQFASDSSGDQAERGAVSVIVAFLLVALLGFAALAVDVGAVYAEKAQLQNGADAAALAIASDCAQGACGDWNATGDAFANDNANDGSSGIQSITFPNATTVRVETNARDAGTGADSFSLYFARALGNNETEIDAAAEASWGAPSAGNTLPWTVSQCVFEQFLSPSQLSELNSTGSFTGDPAATPILMRYDENTPDYPGCLAQNGYNPGGFGWLETTGSGCTADIDIAVTVEGQPGNNFPNEADCVALLNSFMDEPALIPLFSTATGNGGNAVYSLAGFAAFQVTAYKFGGASSVTSSPAPTGCNGNCRGIQGYFTRYVSLAEGMAASAGVPDYGATVVSLSG